MKGGGGFSTAIIFFSMACVDASVPEILCSNRSIVACLSAMSPSPVCASPPTHSLTVSNDPILRCTAQSQCAVVAELNLTSD